MSRAQAGYATVAATGMLAGLSVLGLSYLNLGGASLELSERTTRQILLDGELEEKLAETITALANGVTDTEKFPRRAPLVGDATAAVIIVENEREKLSLSRATEMELVDVLNELGISRGDVKHISRAFREQQITSEGHIALTDLLPDTLSNDAVNCLQSAVTEFRPAAVFKRPGAKENLDGEILRVRIETDRTGRPSRGLEAFVLFTGDRKEPVWVMKWNRYSLTRKEGCRI